MQNVATVARTINPSESEELTAALIALGLDPKTVGLVDERLVGHLIGMTARWKRSLAKATVRGRETDLRRFVRWARQNEIDLFADAERISELSENHLRDAGRALCAASIGRVGSSLNSILKNLGADAHSLGSAERRRLELRARRREGIARSTIDAATTPAKARLSVAEMDILQATILSSPQSETHRLRDAAILLLMRDALLRRSEVVGFRLSDWNPEASEITIARSKTAQDGQGARFIVSDDVRDALCAWLRASGLDGVTDPDQRALTPLFVGVRASGKLRIGTEGNPGSLDGGSICRMLKKHAERAGLPHVESHTIRRSVARALYEAGVPEGKIVEVGRWSSLEQMRAYVGLRPPQPSASMLLASI